MDQADFCAQMEKRGLERVIHAVMEGAGQRIIV